MSAGRPAGVTEMMYITKAQLEVIKQCSYQRVEKFIGAVGLEEGRKRLGEGIKFLNKGSHDYEVITSHLESQYKGSKMEALGWMVSESLLL